MKGQGRAPDWVHHGPHRLRLPVPHRHLLRPGGAIAVCAACRGHGLANSADHAGRARRPARVRLRPAPVAVRPRFRRASDHHATDGPAQPQPVARQPDHRADSDGRPRPGRRLFADCRRRLVRAARNAVAADHSGGGELMASRDRRALLLDSNAYNGIDFVEVANTAQTALVVHFLNEVNVEGTLTGSPVISGGETIPTVAVLPIAPSDWGWDVGHAVLTLRVAAPGDFSNYTLSLASPALDQFFGQVVFSFKAGCPSDLDCETLPAPCPPATGAIPPIDYLAKDFLSFRQALLDFSTTDYPNWQERSEADFGMMFLEAVSAVGDELSYTQDRIAREATLLTATQRRSVLRHARLVDYQPTPAVGAQTWLQFEVAATTTSIPNGLAAIAPAADGAPITFETGLGLRDATLPQPASALWNRAAAI